jgi:hypothetical protein
MIFCLCLQPLLDGLTSLILSLFEVVKSYLAIKIAQHNQKIQSFTTDVQNPIGFITLEEGDKQQ